MRRVGKERIGSTICALYTDILNGFCLLVSFLFFSLWQKKLPSVCHVRHLVGIVSNLGMVNYMMYLPLR